MGAHHFEDRRGQAERDEETIRAALAGSRAATERLARRLLAVPRLVAAIDARRGQRLSEHDIEDLAQDLLVIVWEKLGQFRGTGTLESWLYRFCLLEYMNRVRRLQRLPRPFPLLDPRATPTGASGEADAEALEALLASLGPPEEEIVRLKHFEDLSFAELGERLGLSPNTAKTRYYRGIQWLRRRLSQRVEEAS